MKYILATHLRVLRPMLAVSPSSLAALISVHKKTVFIYCWVNMDHCKIDGKDPTEDKKPEIMQGKKQSLKILE